MKTSVLMTSLCLSVVASGAFAAEVSIKGNVSETVDASNNYFLVNAPSGSTVRSLTAGTLDILAQTPTTQYLLDSHYSYYKYFGPGAADAGGLTWGTPASATFRIDHTTELAKYNIAASWSRVDETQTLLQQTGVAGGRGSINTFSANGGVTRDLGRIDSVSWTANASKVMYTDPSQTPSVDVTTMASWNHNLTQTTTLTNSVSFDWFSEDNSVKSQRLFWKLMTGLQSNLSSRLRFTGHVGEAFVNSYQNGWRATDDTVGTISAAGWNRQWLVWRCRIKLRPAKDHHGFVDGRACNQSIDHGPIAIERYGRIDAQS